MKNKKTIIYILSFFTLFILPQCNDKEDTPETDTISPTISIEEPKANDTIYVSVDPELHIEFTAMDNSALDHLEVKVRDKNNNELLNKHPNVSGLKIHSFHDHITIGSDLKDSNIIVSVEAKDEAGNSVIKTISVHVSN